MPVILNPAGAGKQDPNRADAFVYLTLSQQDKDFVLYRKFVSNDPLNDYIPDRNSEWLQTSVGLPKAIIDLSRSNPNFEHRLLRENSDGTTKILGEDDGLIIQYVGTYAGDRYLDRGRILSAEEADMMMEAGNRVPQFAMWEFRIKDVIATEGPKLRERLLESAEQKAAHERESMFSAIRDAFQAVMGGSGNPEPRTVKEAEAQEALVKEIVKTDDIHAKMKSVLGSEGKI